MCSEMFVVISDSLGIIGGLFSFICQHIDLFCFPGYIERVLPLKLKQQNKILV